MVKFTPRVKMNYEFDHIVISNHPYFEVTKQMLPPQKIKNSLDYYKKLQLPSLDDFIRWIETDTFKRWRAVRPTKDSFREGLLGCDRSLVLGEKMKDELREIDRILEKFRRQFKDDEHVMAVLKMHKREIRKLLKEKS